MEKKTIEDSLKYLNNLPFNYFISKIIKLSNNSYKELFGEEANRGTVHGFVSFPVTDGSGDAFTLFVNSNSKECLLLLYNADRGGVPVLALKGNQYETQEELFSGLPEVFLPLVEDVPQTYEHLNVYNADRSHSLLSTSSLYYYLNGEWFMPEGCKQAIIEYYKNKNKPVDTGISLLSYWFNKKNED